MKEKVAILSILANIILAISKIAAGVFANSSAILASGLDSLTDIFSSLISYIGIKIAGKPADKNHPYGHYKFEVLAGVIITLIILAAGAGVIYQAYRKFYAPADIALGYLAFAVMIFSVLVNEVMARLKIHFGRKEGSLSLLSDGLHSRIDVYSSLAVLAGLIFSRAWIHADAVLALLIGLYIMKEAFAIGREAMGSLLDVSASPEIEEKIRSIAQTEKIEVSNLKTQKKGSAITANLEIKLSSGLTVEQAAKISDNLRKKLIEEIDNLRYVAIQITSHGLETDFYQPRIGSGFGWQRRGKFGDKIKEAAAKGPDGYCVCDKCGYKTPHQRGVPCSSLKCPRCNKNLTRT